MTIIEESFQNNENLKEIWIGSSLNSIKASFYHLNDNVFIYVLEGKEDEYINKLDMRRRNNAINIQIRGLKKGGRCGIKNSNNSLIKLITVTS